MSESFKMGLLGSKEEDNSSKNAESNKEDSPERYAPYSADSDAETYDTEALSIMDINDIIGIQSEPVGDSTLESEFAALSEIITDTQSDAGVTNTDDRSLTVENSSTGTSDGTGKIESLNDSTDKDSTITENNPCAKIASAEDADTIEEKTIIDKNTELHEEVDTDDNNEAKVDDDSKNSRNKEQSDADNNKKDISVDGRKESTDIGSMNNSLQLIGEAYISDDSQETDSDELQVGKELKIVFSCKPLVDKHLNTPEDNTTVNVNEIATDDKCIDSSKIDVSNTNTILDSKPDVLHDDQPVEAVHRTSENILLDSDSTAIIANDDLEKLESKASDVTDNAMEVDDDKLPQREEILNQIKPDVDVINVKEFSEVRLSDPSHSKNEKAVNEGKDDLITESVESKVIDEKAQNNEISNNLIDQSQSHLIDQSEDKMIENKEEVEDEATTGEKNKADIESVIGSETLKLPCMKSEVETVQQVNIEDQNIRETTIVTELDEGDKLMTDINKMSEEKLDEIEGNNVVIKEVTESIEKEKLVGGTSSAENMETDENKQNKHIEGEQITEENIVTTDNLNVENINETRIESSEIGLPLQTSERLGKIEEILDKNSVDDFAIDSQKQIQSENLVIPNKEASTTAVVVDAVSVNTDDVTKDAIVVNPIDDIVDDVAVNAGTADINTVIIESAESSTTDKDARLAVLNEMNENEANPITVLAFSDDSTIQNEKVPEKILPIGLTDVEIADDKKGGNTKIFEELVIEEKPADNVKLLNDHAEDVDMRDSDDFKESDSLIEVILESPNNDIHKSSTTLDATEVLAVPLNDVISNLEPEITSKSEVLPEKKEKDVPVSDSNDPFDELLGLDLIPDEESLINLDTSAEDEVITAEKSVIPQESSSTQLIRPEASGTEVINTENKILAEIVNILDKPQQSVEINDDDNKPDKGLSTLINDSENNKNNKKENKVLGSENKELTEDLEVKVADVADDDQQDADIPLLDKLSEEANLETGIIEPLMQVESAINALPPNSDISELESAVKFLQESEEQDIELPVLLSPKISNTGANLILKGNTSLIDDSSDLVAELDTLTSQDTIEISEAEIINEAAKLENEKKQLTEAQKVPEKSIDDVLDIESDDNLNPINQLDDKKPSVSRPSKVPSITDHESLKIPTDKEIKQVQNLLSTKTTIPKISILEERLREPPKIEIPIVEPRISNIPISPKTSLLIQRDAKILNYQKMLESPKIPGDKLRDELKSSDQSKKDIEKHDFDNAGSPRIILKIAKSAIAECGEPRSPKSPKILRSATNSPNPEDSPGQKLGKIKLKLSKSGHPAIINETNDEPTLQWHTESSSSLSPLGMKIKLTKSGDASIIQPEKFIDTQEDKRLDSPLGMKIKLSKTGDASIVQQDSKDIKHKTDYIPGSPKRTDSPLGMKIKLLKTGDASIIQSDKQEMEIMQDKEIRSKEKVEINQEVMKRTDSPLGMKIKLFKTGDASILPVEYEEVTGVKTKEKVEVSQESLKRVDSPMGMKIKLSKKGGASIVSSDTMSIGDGAKDKLEVPEVPKRTDSPLGMKIKLSKTGDASIIYSEVAVSSDLQQDKETLEDKETSKIISSSDSSSSKDMDTSSSSTVESVKRMDLSIGMKIKLNKDGDATIVHADKTDDEPSLDSKRPDTSIGMKIKFSKTGDASIVQQIPSEIREKFEIIPNVTGGPTAIESMKIKLSKSGHSTIIMNDNDILQAKEVPDTSNMSTKQELSTTRLEVVSELPQALVVPTEMSLKRKDITLSSVQSKKSKLDSQLTQVLPKAIHQPFAINLSEVDQTKVAANKQEISNTSHNINITQINAAKLVGEVMDEKLKSMLTQSIIQNSSSDDCEIIEHHPELIIVNENSNSSQDVMIIDEVSPVRVPDIKMPKKRGRPRRNPVAFTPPDVPQDPLAIDEFPPVVIPVMETRENERPKRTCRSLKSYAPPKRGRGRGRGKRKFDRSDSSPTKKCKLDQSLTEIENSTTALITIDDEVSSAVQNESPELYKALKRPPTAGLKDKLAQTPVKCTVNLSDSNVDTLIDSRVVTRLENDITVTPKTSQVRVVAERLTRAAENLKEASKEASFGNRDHQNWLTPASKKLADATRSDGISSMVQVIDEETRMSAESLSRSQTPARNISVPETPVNEESQGSVVSTATTESEKVKVKNRRMEINFDPDEGPFTVDKIAEYEWPPERKGETFMIQEQISQYLGVKSFKRKYPELKRRVVDMEERNYLRENCLVNESMCDMGLTAICSSEVLDIMCSDFPDHYEEYRKHMRERQIKEHSKKQKELTAAATAEKNRIDLAEMAVQSAVSWNISLNKARRETRKCSLDLQTFTIHVPKKQQRINDESKVGHYPVALIPGQYTDYYREYTPAELRYYPLNTVLYGPMRPNERKFDSQSEGSHSDSDSDSSSDDSSCSSSEGTQDTEESQSTMEDVDLELSNQKDKSLKCKMCLKNLNKNSKQEVLIQCGTCNGHVHPSCIDLTLDMVPHIQAYAWQCTDCKTCAQCHDPADEDKMLFCDMCDRGYHIYCVGLRRVPQGRWHCQECAICASCGSREAGGINAERNSVAQWQHEYKKGDKNTRVYVSTLCVPCSKLWRKGRYCPHCSRCHTIQRLDLEENLVHCSACDKYLHLDCVENKDLIIDKKHFQCDVCMQNRQRTPKTSASKVFRS